MGSAMGMGSSVASPAPDSESAQMNAVKLDSLVSLFSQLSGRIDDLETMVQGIKSSLDDEEKNGAEGDSETVSQLVKDVSWLKVQVNALVRMNSMTPEQRKLRAWLEDKVRLPKYFEVFVQNGIDDLSIVALLDKPTLESMGITAIGHQIKILKEAKQIDEGGVGDQENVAVAASAMDGSKPTSYH